MPGVRLRHPTQSNVRFTISEPDKPFDVPYQCTPPEFGGCGALHLFKTHHLNLDDTGSVIISEQLFTLAQAYLLAFGFEVVGDVAKPPALGVGLGPQVEGRGAWGNIPIIVGGETDGQ